MEKLIIKNFKCFSDIEVSLNDLTIFAGGNGNGKSSAVQSLLLLRRTIEHCSEWKKDHYEYNEEDLKKSFQITPNIKYYQNVYSELLYYNPTYYVYQYDIGNGLEKGLIEYIYIYRHLVNCKKVSLHHSSHTNLHEGIPFDRVESVKLIS